tara:strand:+ start:8485 stop:9213 length:729 start_codon:yes stop_codon:yes gene_type:complete
VTDGKRRWARITTASSAVLLLIAVVSLWQVYDDYSELYDPEGNYIVKLGPGESETFKIESSILVSALRVSDDGTPDANLTLVDNQGNEVTGRESGFLEFDRFDRESGTRYSVVRVFEDVGGEFTLENQGSSSLWLVDDEESATILSGIVWTYLFYIGCCLGSPIGLIGFVLAIMVWTDKRKMPDQFVIIEDGSVIIGSVQGEEAEVTESDRPPSPFSDSNEPPPAETSEEKGDESWKSWDEG